MDLDFSEEQEMLRETVRGVCGRHCSVDVVRAMEDDEVGYPAALWSQLAELGILGLNFPEAYGGSGLGPLEGVVVYEEFGRALAPTPHFVSSVVCGGALMAAGTEEQKREWLPEIASGGAILTPAWMEPDRGFGARGVQLKAKTGDGVYILNGVKRHVYFASSASRLLVLARSGDAREGGAGDGVDLFLVDPASPGVKMTQQFSLSSDTQYRVEFSDVEVPAAARIGDPGSGWNTWDKVMREGIIMLAAWGMGAAARALEITVQYAKEREQFNKPIGAFQAISHYLADATTAVDGGTALVYEAAWALAEGKSDDRLAPMAKLFACDTFRDVTAMCVQVHGGYGFTVDYDIQLYFRRAKQLQISWWDAPYLGELVAASVLDG